MFPFASMGNGPGVKTHIETAPNEDEMRFSERERFVPARNTFQVSSIDEALKNGLWNSVDVCVASEIHRYYSQRDPYKAFAMQLWRDFYKAAIDQMPRDGLLIKVNMRRFIYDCRWYQIYDLLEFILQRYPFSGDKEDVFRN